MTTNEKPSYYAVIPANVRYHPKLTPNAKLLYGEITALCNQKGYCWASNKYFAGLYNTTTISISKWINSLKAEGFINSELNKSENTRKITIITVEPLKKSLIGVKENFKPIIVKYNKVSKDTIGFLEKTPNILLDFWNSLGNTQKHKSPNTSTYQKTIKFLKQIKNGTLYKSVNFDMEYLKRNNITINDLKQKMTDNQVKRVMKNLNLLFIEGYTPENKKMLPKSLPDLIFNPRSKISWFYAYSKNPPIQLYQKVNPIFPDIFKMYRGLFNGNLTGKEESRLINSVNRITKFHTQQCKILDKLNAHSSFSSYCGIEGKPKNFCEMHIEWLSNLRDCKLNSVAATNPELGLFKTFLEWVKEHHGYNFYPSLREIDHMKGVYKANDNLYSDEKHKNKEEGINEFQHFHDYQ